LKERQMDITPDLLLDMYRSVIGVRYFEEKCVEMMQNNLFPGRVHSYIGQEAIAVGACLALDKKDWILSNHRGLGHCLVKGSEPERLFAECLGKKSGYCQGKGGMMHIADIEHRILGTTAIVGSGIPIAVGAALALQLKQKQEVILCFFGDGASNTGAFHEGINLAAIWHLPVIFLCENNQYGEFTPVSQSTLVKDIAGRASAYGIEGEVVDGNDVISVYRVVSETIISARQGKAPSLIEAKTYRIRGHYEGDPESYRTKQEVKKWAEEDPILRLKKKLLEEGIFKDEKLKSIEEEIASEIEDASQRALRAPFPSLDILTKDVYV
jgi:TPP-dependent pyruvate/acetoin dehydrogenase alpha subunit